MSKYTLSLAVALTISWLLWSGHFESPFLLGLGVLSVAFSLCISARMQIIDEEGAPIQLGLRPFTSYAPWLIKEIVISNLQVTRLLLKRKIPLHRNLFEVKIKPKSELGRVILANSITLTPGTVSVKATGDKILIHSISQTEAEDFTTGEIGVRVCRLERGE